MKNLIRIIGLAVLLSNISACVGNQSSSAGSANNSASDMTATGSNGLTIRWLSTANMNGGNGLESNPWVVGYTESNAQINFRVTNNTGIALNDFMLILALKHPFELVSSSCDRGVFAVNDFCRFTIGIDRRYDTFGIEDLNYSSIQASWNDGSAQFKGNAYVIIESMLAHTGGHLE